MRIAHTTRGDRMYSRPIRADADAYSRASLLTPTAASDARRANHLSAAWRVASNLSCGLSRRRSIANASGDMRGVSDILSQDFRSFAELNGVSLYLFPVIKFADCDVETYLSMIMQHLHITFLKVFLFVEQYRFSIYAIAVNNLQNWILRLKTFVMYFLQFYQLWQ